MGFPSESGTNDCYEKANVLKLAKQFENKKYYLIHGTADGE